MTDLEAKKQAIAELIEGRVVDDHLRVEVCIKGTVNGFPATIESLRATFPFGATFTIETQVLPEGTNPPEDGGTELTVMPRYAKGLFGFITRILLLESRGQKIGDKKFDSQFIASFNDFAEAERFLKYPGVMEKFQQLHQYAKFSEIGIRSKVGIYLSQPTSFSTINPDVVRVTFKLLGELGQVLFEAF